MKTRSFLNRWRACLLGAINGLVFTGAYAVVEWLYRHTVETNAVKTQSSAGYNILVSDLHDPVWYWYGTAAWFIALFAIGSFVTHRYLIGWLKTPIVLWLVIGLGALTSWNILGLAGAYYEMWGTGFTVLYREVTSPSSIKFGLNSFILVCAVNLIYGGIIQLSAGGYSPMKSYS